MFRKYLYELIEDDRLKETEMFREYEDWCEESNLVSKAALAWIEEIIMKRTTEQKMTMENRR